MVASKFYMLSTVASIASRGCWFVMINNAKIETGNDDGISIEAAIRRLGALSGSLLDFRNF